MGLPGKAFPIHLISISKIVTLGSHILESYSYGHALVNP